MKGWIQSGTPWVWLTSGAVSVSLLAVLGLLSFIAWQGLTYFWPAPLQQWTVAYGKEQKVIVGQLFEREAVPSDIAARQGVLGGDPELPVTRILIKSANRDHQLRDFEWVWMPHVIEQSQPEDLVVIERRHNGDLYGRILSLQYDGNVYQQQQLSTRFERAIEYSGRLLSKAIELEHNDIRPITDKLNQVLRKLSQANNDGSISRPRLQYLQDQQQQLNSRYLELEQQLFELRQQAQRDHVVVELADGKQINLTLDEVLSAHFPNRMEWDEKFSHWLSGMADFVSSAPRESNSAGGVYPAIFGTVFMVLLMSIVVMPFGVLAAVYLHEYAGKGLITQLIRIAVINLAGVPSIVYGVFGLGFFVYGLGGSIDQLFYSDGLPAPTFGTPGILWAALTLAILTLPVVIVATEEGLARIPSSVRHGSLALGATKFETLWRIVLPMATPAIMTGLILAVARAAGEVAPLMLVGVVKLAPELPLDGVFPFIHLERKFMHLGFHIYDVGFQSANVEAARPLVYATSFLLVMVIVGLNLTAIGVRNHLRRRYQHIES